MNESMAVKALTEGICPVRYHTKKTLQTEQGWIGQKQSPGNRKRTRGMKIPDDIFFFIRQKKSLINQKPPDDKNNLMNPDA